MHFTIITPTDELYLGMAHRESWGLPLVHEIMFHVRRGKLRRPQATALFPPWSTQHLEWGGHSWRSLPLSLLSTPEIWCRDIIWGEKQAVQQMFLISSIRNQLYLQQSMEKFKPMNTLRNSGHSGKRQLGGN